MCNHALVRVLFADDGALHGGGNRVVAAAAARAAATPPSSTALAHASFIARTTRDFVLFPTFRRPCASAAAISTYAPNAVPRLVSLDPLAVPSFSSQPRRRVARPIRVDADAVLVLDSVFIQEPVDIVPRRSTAPSGVSRPSVRAQRCPRTGRFSRRLLSSIVDAAHNVFSYTASARRLGRALVDGAMISANVNARSVASSSTIETSRRWFSTTTPRFGAATRREGVPRLGLVLVANAIHRRRGVE